MLDVDLAPLTGGPTALLDAADRAVRAATRLADAGTRLLRVGVALEGQRSDAVAAARHRVTGLADGARAGAGVREAASAVLRRHAAALRDAQAEAERAIADHRDATARERSWQEEADEARRSTWNTALGVHPATGSPAVSPLDGGPTSAHLRVLRAERELAAARADLLAAQARWRAARDAKDAASRQAVAALGRLADVRAVRAASVAGMTGAQFDASATQAGRAAALVGHAASPAGDDGPRGRTELHRLLTAHADDPAFWAVFWDSATPEQVYDAFGTPTDGPFTATDPAFAAVLARGVEQWSRTASAQELDEFGRQAVEGVGGSPFARAHRAELASALLPTSLPAAAHGGAGDALDAWWGDRAFDDGSLTAMAPVAVAVAGGYAAHRRLAFDRLAPADGTRAAATAKRWLGITPRHGWPDGGRAVAGAFAAAMEVGSTSPDRAEQARAALLVSHATPVLPTGLLASQGLSERAARSVVLAYEPYLPSMGDAVASQGDADDPQEAAPPPGVARGLALVPTSGLPQHTVQPTLDAFALRDVIVATSRTPATADVWLGAADRYADSMIDLSASDAPPPHDPDSRTQAAHEVFNDIGAVAGSIEAPTISEAHARVQTREALLSLAGMGIGVASIGRSAVESAAATVGSTSLSFLSRDAPLIEATGQVRAKEEVLFQQYGTRLHDTFVAQDVAAGLSPDAARLAHEDIDPRSESTHSRTVFEKTYRLMAETIDEENRP